MFLIMNNILNLMKKRKELNYYWIQKMFKSLFITLTIYNT